MRNILFIFSLILPFNTFATESTDEDYDSIVRKLTTRQSLDTLGESIFDDVMFHVGLGVSSTTYGIKAEQSDHTISKQGFSLALGVDLFSPKWLAEITFSNYGEQQNETFTTALKEFDMKVVYKYSLAESWNWRMGAGLAARYLNLNSKEYTTPSSILLTGIEFKVTKNIGLTSEFGYRTPMISETPEKTALDLLFRLDSHL